MNVQTGEIATLNQLRQRSDAADFRPMRHTAALGAALAALAPDVNGRFYAPQHGPLASERARLRLREKARQKKARKTANASRRRNRR